MSLRLRNRLTRQENERIVRRVLDTKIRIGGKSSSIRNKGRARNLDTNDGYAIVNAIKEVIEDNRLDVIQEGMLFAELDWRFECSECHVVKDLSGYVEANSFEIKVTDNDFKLKSVGCCMSCDEQHYDENDWGDYQLSSGRIQDLPGDPNRNYSPRR
ncbi:uncharacterized protein TrAFT101_010865 [Trichoderma asperellum]|uniref:Uncharacterized protein n=1 Tax=Trichoderma asperellum (strain ATCC 204424 / CBS 433.97 / NBRC 101777) TaxID=1042311 RepID=A0A2T3YX62_TRIA4|nr:hypothetical protein M441DRAFT_30326 [Trichoderma asperellum CBS 433.97]PTB37132.1 hypothetical protein M441DRAFT_30326 [Trichoderma asperellum CBS 433.97]UKZ96064.1 hypothetical protein TrAFT101_010865 [Trichoderma asperellum]